MEVAAGTDVDPQLAAVVPGNDGVPEGTGGEQDAPTSTALADATSESSASTIVTSTATAFVSGNQAA